MCLSSIHLPYINATVSFTNRMLESRYNKGSWIFKGYTDAVCGGEPVLVVGPEDQDKCVEATRLVTSWKWMPAWNLQGIYEF